MITKIFRRIYHFSLFTFAALTLTVAVCLSIFRLALPNIGEYREDFQTWITESMGHPLEIKQLDAGWQGWIPHFYLHDIRILDESGHDSIANFHSAHITIDIMESLRQRELVPSQLTISGMDLTIIRKKNGSINIAKTGLEMEEQDFTNTELAVWLLKQRRIALSDIKITLLDLTTENIPPVLLSDVSLTLQSNAFRLQIEGDAKLPQKLGKKISFALDAYGDILTPTWSGEIYLEGSSIYPPAWFDNKTILGTHIESEPGNIRIWTDWRNAKIRKIEGKIDITDVSLKSDYSHFDIQHLVTNFTLERRTDNGVELSLDIEELTTFNGSWPKSNISISKHLSSEDESYRYISKSSYLKLDDIADFVNVFPELRKNLGLIEQKRIQGELTHALFIYDPSLPTTQQYFIDTNVELTKISGSSDESVITGLSGHLQGNAKKR